MGHTGADHFELDASHREALTAARAEELLAPLGAGATSVKLGGKSFGDGSAAVAAAALARAAPTLVHLDIADVIASRPEDEAKRALAAFADGLRDAKALASIDLSDNALGAKGIREVRGILAGQTALESLKLCNNGLAADAGELIAAALLDQPPTKLKLLHFHNNLLESAGAKALAPIVENSPGLEDFRFSALRLHHDGAARICTALACVPDNLRCLNFSDNNFGADGARALATALSKCRSLKVLNLRDTALCDDGIAAVSKALRGASARLAFLDLSGNEMTAVGAKAVGAAMQGMPVLETLLIEDNELGNAGAKHIAKALHPVIHAVLKRIDAASSEIGTSGALALGREAHQLPVLEVLNLNANAIAGEAVEDLKSLLDDKLASLSDNDDDGDDEDDEDEDEDEDDSDNELEDGDADDSGHPSANGPDVSVDNLAAAVKGMGV